MAFGAPALVWIGLSGCATPTPAPTDGPPADSWPMVLAAHPERFSALIADNRAGWIALHTHRYPDAEATGGLAGQRAARARIWLWRDLDRLTGEAWDRLARASEARGPIPDGLLAGASLAALCTGVGDRAHWSEKIQDAEVQAFVRRPDPRVDPHGLSPGSPLAARAAAWASGSPPPEGALWIEPGDAFERRYPDPCVPSRLAEGDWRPAGDGLGAVLFSGWVSPASIPRDAASWADLGASEPLPQAELGASDDPQAARDAVHALDDRLTAWRAAALARADVEGRSLVVDLHVFDRLRQELLVGRGRALLAHDRPRQALATLELAVDPTADGGPTDNPALWALLADARLRTGRTREALDALAHLRPTWPALIGTIETVEDLAVLEGLDRRGDSKEH